jgi:hypothetical protein
MDKTSCTLDGKPDYLCIIHNKKHIPERKSSKNKNKSDIILIKKTLKNHFKKRKA